MSGVYYATSGTWKRAGRADVAPVIPPSPPTNFTAVATNSTTAFLSWTASTVPAGGGAIIGYKLYSSAGSLRATLSNVTSTSRSGLTPGTTFSYYVRAITADAESGFSNTASVTPPLTANVPNAPGSVTATATSDTSISVSWAAATLPAGVSAVTGYKVYAGSGSLLATLGSAARTYSWTGLTAGSPYSAYVTAVNTVGESVASTVATATTTGTAPPTGWPDASNTGPTVGLLTVYSGPLTITTDNTIISAKNITGELIIRAANVLVKDCIINGNISTDENSTGYSFTIQDSKVNIGDNAGTGIGAVNFTALRCEVTGGNRSINCWKNAHVEDCWVHGQFTDPTGTYHESGIRMGANGVIVHNSIGCDAADVPPDAGCSADMSGYGDFAIVENMLIQANRFLGSTGGFCAYGGSTQGKAFSAGTNNIRFIDNVFERGASGKCGSFGPITDFDPAAPGNVWTNNTWADGAVVSPA